MQFSVKFSGVLVILWVGLNGCLGDPACPCQSQSAKYPCQSPPANCPCQTPQPASPNDCYSNYCKTVQTLPAILSDNLALSPFYITSITVTPGEKDIDSICCTYCPLDNSSSVEFITNAYSDGTYQVLKTFASNPKPGTIRLMGFANEAGDSTFVTNDYIFGVVCENSTSISYLIYSCVLFADCSLSQTLNGDILYTLSSSPDVDGSCLDQAEGLFAQSGLQVGALTRPPHRLHRRCVTSFNGVPCLNADRVPAGDGIAYPPPQCDCACN